LRPRVGLSEAKGLKHDGRRCGWEVTFLHRFYKIIALKIFRRRKTRSSLGRHGRRGFCSGRSECCRVVLSTSSCRLERSERPLRRSFGRSCGGEMTFQPRRVEAFSPEVLLRPKNAPPQDAMEVQSLSHTMGAR
jgi:hypothetical protein